MAYTLAQRREHHMHRTYCTVGGDGTLAQPAAAAKAPTNPPDVAMIFSGQGAQWPQMGRELILTNSLFRSDIGAMDNILQSLQHPPAWSIEGQFSPPSPTL